MPDFKKNLSREEIQQIDEVIALNPTLVKMGKAAQEARKQYKTARNIFNDMLSSSPHEWHALLEDIAGGNLETAAINNIESLSRTLAQYMGPAPEEIYKKTLAHYSGSLPDSDTKSIVIRSFRDIISDLRNIHESGQIGKFMEVLPAAVGCSRAARHYQSLNSVAEDYYYTLLDHMVASLDPAESRVEKKEKPRSKSIHGNLAATALAATIGVGLGAYAALEEHRRKKTVGKERE